MSALLPAPPPADEGGVQAVETAVRELEGMNIDALRLAWRQRCGKAPPRLRAADVLRRFLAERIQLDAFGGDPELDAQIAALVKRHRRGERLAPARPVFRPGTVLVREYGGRTHHVEVRDQGFDYANRRWDSLSQIAREITGVRWNGPRFFGLRDTKLAEAGR
jgi:hypothetical protein